MKYIVHLGFSGFPKGMASTQRTFLTFKGLKGAGVNPLIINKISHHQYADNNKVKHFDGIPYVNTACYNSKPASFIKRNINKLSGYFGELRLLVKKKNEISTAILYSTYFLEYPYYFFISRILRFKIVIQYVELFSAIPGRQSFFTKINDHLIDKYIGLFCDGVIAISEHLKDAVKKSSPDTPVFKMPANSDFSIIEAVSASNTGSYLMYCGTIYYEEVIEFLISVFIKLKENNKYEGYLLLVISGDHETNWQKLRSFIKTKSFQEEIIIKSDIPYSDLLSYYKGAELLLIPMRNSLQDIARFPHKIGEYTAAKRPILSTNIGELRFYFKDGVSALLVDSFSIDAYYEKICTTIGSKSKLDEIGYNGYRIGMDNFDYKMQGEKLKEFIDSVHKN